MLTLRFYVSAITRRAGNDHVEVELSPAYKEGRNADWAKWTPSGSIKLSVSNPSAIAQLDAWLNAGGTPADIHITMDAVVDEG